MAWVDTLITLRGATGYRGITGATGFGGGGLNTYANVYSNNDPTKGALHNINGSFRQSVALSPLPAQSFTPSGVVVDFAGRYYFTSQSNNAVYRIDRDGTVFSIMGGISATRAPTAAIIPGIETQVSGALGIAINSERTIIYVACVNSNCIVKYDITTGLASALDPAILSIVLSGPRAICLGKVPNGSGSVVDALFIVNSLNDTVGQYTMGPTPRYSRIAGLFPGTIYAGFSGDGGPAISAPLRVPTDVCQVVGSSSQSVLLIADYFHNRVRQVVINGPDETSGTISTVVGNGVAFNSVDINDDPLGNAVAPFGIQYASASDTLYITSDRRLRQVQNFRTLTPSLSTIVGQTITASSDWTNLGTDGFTASVSSLKYGIHIDYYGNVITAGNSANPLLVYTTGKLNIVSVSPEPRLGDVVNWNSLYDNGAGLYGVTQWIYNTYESDYLSGVALGAEWRRLGGVTSGGIAPGVRGLNSSVTGATGPDGPTVRGPLGPVGPAQTAAPDGPAGPTGAVGVTNNLIYESRGQTGHEGAFGEAGPQGPDGPSVDGPAGPKGQTGSQGVRHANFYQDIPFPQAAVGFANPFPESSLPGDYYIKEDSTKLYHYSETVPPNSYYLNRVLNTSSTAINGVSYNGLFNPESHAKGILDPRLVFSETIRNAGLATAKQNYKNGESRFYDHQRIEALYSLDRSRKELSSIEVIANSPGTTLLNGSTTAWTTRGSPYIYEFFPAPNSIITTSTDLLTSDNYYAAVAVDGTFIDGIYVFAGYKNPIFPITDTPNILSGRPLYIISTVNLTGNLPYVNYQIFWYKKNVPVIPAIPSSAVIATYVGIAVNKKVTSTAAYPTGYDISLFFTNANCGSFYTPDGNLGGSYYTYNSYHQFDNKNKLPDNCEAAMLYGLNGSPVIGDYSYQFPWRVQNHFGGLIELKMSVSVSDLLSGGFAIPTNAGRYGLLNVTQTATNDPMFPNNYTTSLVTTVRFPSNPSNIADADWNPVTSNAVTAGVIAVHPITGDVYFTQALRSVRGDKIGESLLVVRSSDRQNDGFTYSNVSVIFSRAADGGIVIPDGTPLANVGCMNITGMAFDNIGNLYYSDFEKHCVRMLNLIEANPSVRTVAGVYGTPEYNAISGSVVKMDRPRGIRCRNGYLYVVDSGNHSLIRVDIAYRGLPPIVMGAPMPPTGSIRGRPGLMNSPNFGLDNLVLNNPTDVEVDAVENIYVSDSTNHCIWRINLEERNVVMFVGSWYYDGVDAPPPSQPPPSGPAWWEWLLVAIAIVVVIIAIVVTFGAAAPAAAPLAPLAAVPAVVTPVVVPPLIVVPPLLAAAPVALGVTTTIVTSVPTVTATAVASGVAAGYLSAITVKSVTLTVLATGAVISGLSM